MATGGQARNHHWIPQCYLKGFSKNRSKNAKLFVVDTIGRKTFETIPRNVASARDFNRFDAPGVAPDHFESEYSRFEGLADKALERLCTTHHFGNDEDHNLILNLIALLVARNPLMRENSRQFQERALKLMMSITLATKDRYEASLTQAVRAGAVERDSDVTYESMREFVNGERYTIEIPTTRHVELELQLSSTVLPLLGQRDWLLIRAPTLTGGFVTCDHPVVLQWSEQKDRGASCSPGFALQGTDVIFTLSHELALLGTFGGENGEIDAVPDLVALINGIVISHAHRQIYAKDNRFRYATASGVVRRGADIVQDLSAPP